MLSHLEEKTVGHFRSNQKNKKRYVTFCRKKSNNSANALTEASIQRPAISLFLEVCLNLTQFIIYCLAAPENSKLLIGYLNIYEDLNETRHEK